jgi:sulfopropanediol 3-dehydrogenase
MAAVRSLPSHVLSDLEYARSQAHRFATIQRSAIRDVESETIPRVVLGHRNIPVESVGCYIPGGRYPLIAAAHSEVTAKAVGVGRVIWSAPISNRRPHAAIVVSLLRATARSDWYTVWHGAFDA